MTFASKLLSSLSKPEVYSSLKYLYATERQRQSDDVENTQFSFGTPWCNPYFGNHCSNTMKTWNDTGILLDLNLCISFTTTNLKHHLVLADVDLYTNKYWYLTYQKRSNSFITPEWMKNNHNNKCEFNITDKKITCQANGCMLTS